MCKMNSCTKPLSSNLQGLKSNHGQREKTKMVVLKVFVFQQFILFVLLFEISKVGTSQCFRQKVQKALRTNHSLLEFRVFV